MKIKFSFAILVFSMICSSYKSQTWPITVVNSVIDTIPNVFEGQVQSVEIYAGDDNGNRLPWSSAVWNGDIGYLYDQTGERAKGYSLAKIKICKLYKGDLAGAMEIKVLTKSFTLDNVWLEITGSGADADTVMNFLNTPPSHDESGKFDFILPHVSYPKKLYFCDRIDPILSSSYAGAHFYSNFHSILEAPFDLSMGIEQPDGTIKTINAHCALFSYVFDDQNQLQLFLNQITSINPYPYDNCRGTVKTEVPKEVDDGKTTINHTENKRRFSEWFDIANKRLENCKLQQLNLAAKTSANNLALDVINERVVRIGSDNWLEFDVYSSANSSGLYFDNCIMRFQYNTSAFGTSVTANNNIVITRATPYIIPTYVDPMTLVNDFANNSVSVPFGINTNTSPINRIQLSTTPTLMVTIRIKISACNQPANLTFTDQTFLSSFCWYTPAANTSTNTNVIFNNVVYNGNITDQTCKPIITNWTNSEPAGEHKTITITGKYFGDKKSNGAALILRNSDQGNRYPLLMGTNKGGIQAYDLVSWNHNQIVFVLPNVIDSAFYVNPATSATVGPKEVYPGTGKFKIINYANGVAESNAPIVIPHSVNQYVYRTNEYYKYHARLAGYNTRPTTTLTGYRVLINNSVNTAWPNAKPTIKKAMQDWNCATEFQWWIGGDTIPLSNFQDDYSVITTSPTGPLMQTEITTQTCKIGNVRKYWLVSFDIKIQQNVSPYAWNFDTLNANNTGNYDFYSLISHELGHGHQVGHINDSIQDMMWWLGYPIYYPMSLRKTVVGSPDARTAGEYVTDSLLSNFPQCIGVHTPLKVGNCEAFNVSIKKYVGGAFNILVFPNPSNSDEIVRLHCDFPAEKQIEIRLSDITGKQLLKYKVGKTKQLDYELITKEINPGIYLLQIEIDSQTQSFKILKQ